MGGGVSGDPPLRSFSDMLGESNYEKRKSFFKKK